MLVVLIAMSSISAFLIYTSLQSTSARLDLIASQRGREDIEAHVGSGALSLSDNLGITSEILTGTSMGIATSEGDLNQIHNLLSTAYLGINRYADALMYVNNQGILVDAIGMDNLPRGADLSVREYYKEVSLRNTPYITGLYTSSDNSTNIALATPVPASSTDRSFNGLLVARITVDSLSKHIMDLFPSSYKSQFTLIDENGLIITSGDGKLIGKNVDTIFQEATETVSRNLELMAQGKAGNFEFTDIDGIRKLTVYDQVPFRQNAEWTLLVIRPLNGIDQFGSVLDEQREYTLIAIVLIAAVSAIFFALIIFINQRLHRTVEFQGMQIQNQLTDLQNAYNRLKEQDLIKDEFINIAAHELRTPILPIILSAEGLEEDLGTSNNKVEIILRNAKRINKLTNDILDVSRIESNTFRLQKEKINIRRLIDEAIQDELLKLSEYENKDVRILFEDRLDNNKDFVNIDKERINQVIYNLLDNAINFTDNGGITIILQKSRNNPRFNEVKVIDSGRGIDHTIEKRLFGKFVTKSHKAKGTGLGLYLSKAIVEAHGGTIWAENNPGGRGATFAFTIPIE